MRLLAAVRLSRHRGEADPSTSPTRQEEVIAGWSGQRDHEVVGWARDLDVSAIKLPPFERPELGPWLETRHREYDGVVWAKLDRAVRKIDDLHTLAVWASKHKKALFFAAGPGSDLTLDFTEGGSAAAIAKIILTLLAFVAEMEGDAIRERNKATRDWLREVGRWPGGMYPYHTLPVKIENEKGWWLKRNPETWEVLEEIIERVLDLESKLSIANDLNARGVPSPREYRLITTEKVTTAPVAGIVEADGEAAKFRKKQSRSIRIRPDEGSELIDVHIFPRHAELAVVHGQHVDQNERITKPILWNSKTIADMLRAPALIGQQRVNGKLVLGKSGMPVKRVDAIITKRDDWERLQRILDEAPTIGANKSSGENPYLGVGFCAACGSRLNRRHQRQRNYLYYGCRSHWSGDPRSRLTGGKCPSPAIRGEILDAVTTAMLLGEIGDREIMARRTIPGTPRSDELKDAEAAYAECIDRIAGKKGHVREVLERKIARLEELITELAEQGDVGEEDRVETYSTGTTWKQFWPSASAAERQKKMFDTGVKIYVGKPSAAEMTVLDREMRRWRRAEKDIWYDCETDSGHTVAIMVDQRTFTPASDVEPDDKDLSIDDPVAPAQSSRRASRRT